MKKELKPFDLKEAIAGKKIIHVGVIGEYKFTNKNSVDGDAHVFQFAVDTPNEFVKTFISDYDTWYNGFSEGISDDPNAFMAPEKKSFWFVLYESKGRVFTLISGHDDYEAAKIGWDNYEKVYPNDILLDIREITIEI